MKAYAGIAMLINVLSAYIRRNALNRWLEISLSKGQGLIPSVVKRDLLATGLYFNAQKEDYMATHMVTISEYPELKLLAWNIHLEEITEEEAFAVYEAGWKYVAEDLLTKKETDLIQRLTRIYGKGVMNV